MATIWLSLNFDVFIEDPLGLDYENILLLTAVTFRGDYQMSEVEDICSACGMPFKHVGLMHIRNTHKGFSSLLIEAVSGGRWVRQRAAAPHIQAPIWCRSKSFSE
jgi:hypothetical protein